jgi:hypothetical protein
LRPQPTLPGASAQVNRGGDASHIAGMVRRLLDGVQLALSNNNRGFPCDQI